MRRSSVKALLDAALDDVLEVDDAEQAPIADHGQRRAADLAISSAIAWIRGSCFAARPRAAGGDRSRLT
jgi:hypothetical protein